MKAVDFNNEWVWKKKLGFWERLKHPCGKLEKIIWASDLAYEWTEKNKEKIRVISVDGGESSYTVTVWYEIK